MTDTVEPDTPSSARLITVAQQVCDRCGCVVALWDLHTTACAGIIHAPTTTED